MSREEYIKKHGGDKISFDLVDEATVKKLQRDGVVKVPKKTISVPKDKRWNQKFIGSKTLQGIQNGSSVQDIAKSIFPEIYEKAGKPTVKGLIDRCKQSAIRNARTMTTAAENAGRIDSYKNLEKQGVVQKKVWIATPDDRTRESHLEIDGEEVGINQEFSNGCMFPGDPDCDDPGEVWNCRCSMRTHIVGFRRADGTISKIQYDRKETMHNRQMAEEKERREKKEGDPHGKNSNHTNTDKD